jgi:DNA-binding MarR family transcriptional regulator
LRAALQAEIVLSRSALSRCVDRMASAGLVAKDDCPEDPRGMIVRLLPAGKAALKAAWPVYREQILANFGRHFSAEELHFLVDRFGKLSDAGYMHSLAAIACRCRHQAKVKLGPGSE